MEIRPYTPSDQDDVIALWHECHLTVPWNDPVKDIQRKLAQDPDLFFVGLVDNHLMASCMAGYDGHRGWIYYLAVKPQFQNQNYAKQLVRHAEDGLSTLGCPKINLMVRNTNTQVIGFYQAIGYSKDPVCVLSRRLENDSS